MYRSRRAAHISSILETIQQVVENSESCFWLHGLLSNGGTGNGAMTASYILSTCQVSVM